MFCGSDAVNGMPEVRAGKNQGLGVVVAHGVCLLRRSGAWAWLRHTACAYYEEAELGRGRGKRRVLTTKIRR